MPFMCVARYFFRVIRLSCLSTIENNGIEYAGYISFLSLLSLFPFLIFLTLITGFFSSIFSLEAQLLPSLLELLLAKNVPHTVMEGLVPHIQEILRYTPPQSILTLAIVNIIWTSSSIIEGIRTILNIAYRSRNETHYILGRLLSIVQFLVIAFVLAGAIILITLIPKLVNTLVWHFSFPFADFYYRYIGFFVLYGTLFWMYRFIPSKRMNLYATLIGAGTTLALWSISSVVFAEFIRRFSQFSLIYGSLGSMIISLLFFYILAVSFIFTAQLIFHLSSDTEKYRKHGYQAQN